MCLPLNAVMESAPPPLFDQRGGPSSVLEHVNESNNVYFYGGCE